MHTVKKLLLSILVITAFLSCGSTEKDTREKKADIYFASGTQNLMEGNYTQALTQLIKAVKLSPKRSDIHNNLGMAYYFKGSKKNAIKHVKKALKLDSKNTDARSNLASIYFEAKLYKRARKQYETILEDLTYPKQYQTYYNLGILELKFKRVEKAKNFFNLAIKENQYYCPAHLRRGLIDFKEKNYDLAVDSFAKGSDGPCYNYEATHFYHALSLQKQGKFTAAKTLYRKIIQRFPKSRYHPMSKEKLAALEADSNFENVIYSEGTIGPQSSESTQEL